MRIKTYFSILLIGIFALSVFMISPSVYAGDYVNLTKAKLGGEFKDQLKSVYEAWDKYAKDAKKMYPEQVAEVQAQITIAEAAAAENDMPKFKKEMKKLKKAPKFLKKLAGKSKTFLSPQGLEGFK